MNPTLSQQQDREVEQGLGRYLSRTNSDAPFGVGVLEADGACQDRAR